MADWTKPGAYLARMDSAEIWQQAPEPKPNVLTALLTPYRDWMAAELRRIGLDPDEFLIPRPRDPE